MAFTKIGALQTIVYPNLSLLTFFYEMYDYGSQLRLGPQVLTPPPQCFNCLTQISLTVNNELKFIEICSSIVEIHGSRAQLLPRFTIK